jgi:hypothetical protein
MVSPERGQAVALTALRRPRSASPHAASAGRSCSLRCSARTPEWNVALAGNAEVRVTLSGPVGANGSETLVGSVEHPVSQPGRGLGGISGEMDGQDDTARRGHGDGPHLAITPCAGGVPISEGRGYGYFASLTIR